MNIDRIRAELSGIVPVLPVTVRPNPGMVRKLAVLLGRHDG